MHLIGLVNTGSGTRSKKQFLREIAYQCFDTGWTYEVRSSWYVNDPRNIKRILSEKNVAIVICGGDGTITKVLKAFWQQKALSKVNFLIYPGGTFNALMKNTGFNHHSIHHLVSSLKKNRTLSIDLLEVEIKEGKKVEKEICQTGALFIKDCRFAEHAAQIQKALHQFDFNLGFRSVQKSLPYLEEMKTFEIHRGGRSEVVQAFYIANNPFLITEKPIHSRIHIHDGKFESFRLQDADFFQIGQSASVLLLGIKRDLSFLKVAQHRQLSLRFSNPLHLNLDGDIRSIKKGTEVNIKVSSQKARLIKYL